MSCVGCCVQKTYWLTNRLCSFLATRIIETSRMYYRPTAQYFEQKYRIMHPIVNVEFFEFGHYKSKYSYFIAGRIELNTCSPAEISPTLSGHTPRMLARCGMYVYNSRPPSDAKQIFLLTLYSSTTSSEHRSYRL